VSLAGTFGGGAAFDSTGQIAAYTFGGGGPAVGQGIVIGEQFAGSNAPTVQDLNGLFKTVGGGGGADAAGAIDYFEGITQDGCKKIRGGGLTAGVGAGEFVMAAPTWTTVYNSGRLW
jgi:hypothetical protein